MTGTAAQASQSELHRGLGLVQATALNVANMVGIGPFITIPLFLQAMQGPQALIAWPIAALVVICDGLVWSELGAALPGSGGSYHFLSQTFGRYRWGRLLPFLFIWQFLVTGTLEMASGYIGAVDYLTYALPGLDGALAAWHVPGGRATVAAAAALVITLLLCRHIRWLGWLGVFLCAGTILTVLIVIVAGQTHFNSGYLTLPKDAFRVTPEFFGGLGGAMSIAVYDYLGYYNVCHLGDEVVNPGKTIPRAVMISVVLVAAIYLTMNVAIIGVIPWQKAMESKHIASEFMETLFGRDVAVGFSALILWTVVACMFAITLGYSRIPYAAARDGGFFRIFAVVHPVHRYPVVSLLALGALTAAFCYFPLADVINATVIIRIPLLFVSQIVALHVLRTTRPDVHLPFRMRLYPLPSIIALVGWVFLISTADRKILLFAAGVWVSGCVVFAFWRLVALAGDEAAHLEFISGRRTGPLAALVRKGLSALSVFYGAGVWCRNRLFDLGLRHVARASVPVVSIGNLTTGGTGKTPFAAFVARWFHARGVRVSFLSRGYGAEGGALNDEARVLEQLCPEVPHVQNPDRVAGAQYAVHEHGAELVILDDGFQHRRLARDLDIVLVDALAPWGYDYLLPRGLLREPSRSLRRAGLVVITRADRISPDEIDLIRLRIAQADPRLEVVQVAFPPERLMRASGQTAALDALRGTEIAAFCGIGNPDAFRAGLERLGYRVTAFRSFPDHHRYSPGDLDELARWAATVGATALVTTQKDLVKIRRDSLGDRPLWAIQIGTQITDGAERLEARLEEVLGRRSEA